MAQLFKSAAYSRIKNSRDANIRKRMGILKRKGVLNTSDDKALARAVERGKQAPQKDVEILTPFEKLEQEKAARKSTNPSTMKTKSKPKAKKKAPIKAKPTKKVTVSKRPPKAKKAKKREIINLNNKPEPIKRVSMYVPFQRVDEEKRMVYGIATSEVIDSYGDVVRITAIEKALPDYMEFGNIREMHGPSAVGTVKEHELNMDDKHLWIGVKVVDDAAWEKVVEGVYKGFSIGGNIIEFEWLEIEVPVDSVKDEKMDKEEWSKYVNGEKKVSKEQETITVWTGGMDILELELVEISLVDRPACPEALIDSFKAAAANKKSFVPERAFVFSAPKKAKKSKSAKAKAGKALTTLAKQLTLESSLRKSDKPILTSLAQKFAMSKSQLKKATAAVLKFLKSNGVDLSDENADKAVQITRGELLEFTKTVVEKALEIAKQGGESDDESDTEEDEVETTDEEVDTEVETDVEESEDDADEDDDEEGEDDVEGDDEEDDVEDDEDSEEDDEEEDDEDTQDDDDTEPSDLEKAITKTLKPLASQVSKLTKTVGKIEKATKARSTQKNVELDEDGEPTKNVFKGLF